MHDTSAKSRLKARLNLDLGDMPVGPFVAGGMLEIQGLRTA